MVLHLLGKKSWNVYNHDNIEKVRRDEAAAAAKEEEADRRMQEYDAARRIAILRGEEPPPLPEVEEDSHGKRPRRDDDADDRSRDDRRKRRRLAGEDDTDRDIRLAREDAERTSGTLVKTQETKKTSDAPIVDHAGHTNLFPVDEKKAVKAEKNAEAEAEKKRKERELEDQYTMRFSNAAGRDGLDKKPWYAEGTVATIPQTAPNGTSTNLVKCQLSLVDEKDAWGRPDPRRPQREEVRINASDPMAGMKRAQAQLKAAERDRKTWAEDREREMRRVEKARKREEKEERRRRRRERKNSNDDVGELEGFSLDATPRREKRKDEDRHRPHRSLDRSRHRDDDRRGRKSHLSGYRDRSRSRSRDRQHSPLRSRN